MATLRPEAKQGLCFFGLAEMTSETAKTGKMLPSLLSAHVCPASWKFSSSMQASRSWKFTSVFHTICATSFVDTKKCTTAILVWFSLTETCLHSHDVQLPKPSPILSLPKSPNRYPKTPKRNSGICAEVDAPVMTVMIGDIVGSIVFGSSTPAAHAWTGHSSPTNLSESQPGSTVTHADSPK